MRRFLLALVTVASLALPALAVTPDEMLKDPALEARARALSTQLRCMVCQNQSIDDSNADLAKDLRLLVRERIAGGDSDEQVIAYLVSRYGEFVLLKPRFSMRTLILWGAPAFLLVAGGLSLAIIVRRRPKAARAETPLDPEEEARLAKLLAEDKP